MNLVLFNIQKLDSFIYITHKDKSMSVRLWPQDYERRDQFNKAERALLRNAARNFNNGHFAVGIDPVGLSTSTWLIKLICVGSVFRK